jgi:hypothetical protein
MTSFFLSLSFTQLIVDRFCRLSCWLLLLVNANTFLNSNALKQVETYFSEIVVDERVAVDLKQRKQFLEEEFHVMLSIGSASLPPSERGVHVSARYSVVIKASDPSLPVAFMKYVESQYDFDPPVKPEKVHMFRLTVM